MRRLLAACALGALAACGQEAPVPQVVHQTPVTAAAGVAVRQTGSAPAVIDQSSVHFSIDASGGVVISTTVRSQAQAKITLMVRASLYDATGALIGDADGGALSVAPGAAVAVRVTGPAPHGTIASATFEVTSVASPTPA